ncbi:PTS sugar transporter subunit IIA [Clostridium celatum]|uniref:PTS sugar transporter subunit IIA n=1 Tax=Clostridium celatum TaxID=36834 RepID=UPI002A8BF367|nr:PTS sugar transporter subunit IIA [Clostridium celatum]
MVGFIITGHGNFASGLYSACKMLIGERENIEVVDYIDSEKVYDLDKKISSAISNLYGKCEKIIIFCDMLNGSPFKRCMVRCIREPNKFYVLTGVNVPILIESISIAENGGNCDSIIEYIKNLFPNTLVEGISKLRDEMKEYEII